MIDFARFFRMRDLTDVAARYINDTLLLRAELQETIITDTSQSHIELEMLQQANPATFVFLSKRFQNYVYCGCYKPQLRLQLHGSLSHGYDLPKPLTRPTR